MGISFILWQHKRSLRNSGAEFEENSKDVRHGYHWVFEKITEAQIPIDIQSSYVIEGLLVWDPKTAVKKKHSINHLGFWRCPLFLTPPKLSPTYLFSVRMGDQRPLVSNPLSKCTVLVLSATLLALRHPPFKLQDSSDI